MAEADWSAAENWAWGEIAAGRIADFHRDQGKALDPKDPEGWGESRILRPDFLKEILFRSPWREQIPVEGVRIIGALFTEKVDLAHGRLGHQLWLETCRFEQAVNFTDVHIDGRLDLRGSTFLVDARAAESAVVTSLNLNASTVTGSLIISSAKLSARLNMNALIIGQHLIMDNGEFFQEVDLTAAKISGQLSMIGARITGALGMNGITVGQHLFLSKGEFQEIILSGSNVDGQIILTESIVYFQTDMNGITVKQDIFMNGPNSLFQNVDLTGANVEGYFIFSDANVNGALNMDSLTVKQHLFMKKVICPVPIRLTFAQLGGNLDLRDAEISDLDLSAARIAGEFRPAAKWRTGTRLSLVNAHAGTIDDSGNRNTWPETLELDGFTYDRLGGFASVAGDMLNRPADWFCGWLARDTTYAPQPYEQLATVLRAAAQPEKANAVLYAGRERVRAEAWNRREWGRWLGLSLLKAMIGYGLGGRYFRALVWVLALMGVGMIVLVHFAAEFAGGWITAAAYSFDRLLPLVELDPGFKDIRLSSWPRYLFMGYEIIGYVLASFLVAGLAGLTQK